MVEFKVNDIVMHSREGLSQIISCTSVNDKEFFLVQVKRSKDQTIYVPVLNASNIIRHIMAVEEADVLLGNLNFISKDFNSNTKQRRDAYKKRLSSGDIQDMAYLYRQYHLFKLNPDGVKLGPADIEMLEYATNYLLDELALTYGVSRDLIGEFVSNRITELE